MDYPVDRRRFLHGLGIGIALPMLESFGPSRLHAATAAQSETKRLVCIGTYLGFHQKNFFPAQTGANYEMPSVLSALENYRERMTVFSGLDHRGRNGHEGWKAWMTGSATGSVSMDQLVAGYVGKNTRFDSIQLTCGTPPGAARLSFTKEGIALPMIGRPSVLYQTLFRSDSDKERLDYLLSSNASVLDGVLDEAKQLKRNITPDDRNKLDEYLASLRDVEKKLQKQRAWMDKPTPQVDYKLPQFDPVSPDLALECETVMYDLMALALSTDSTRVITFLVPGWSQVFTINGRKLSAGYHGLSHHGNDPAKISEYNLVGAAHVQRFGEFVSKLAHHRDADDQPLIDSTAIVFGSGMGDSNTHDNSNLPTLLLGGSFKHGQHHKIERQSDPRLLGDLFLSVMNRIGVDASQFGGATHNVDELLA